MKHSVQRTYRQAYRRLHTASPLPFDCGTLCQKRCCQGTQKDGMWLLPGEAEFLQTEPGFSVQPCQDNQGYPLLVCAGRCRRKRRPLACRIYPLFPLITPAASPHSKRDSIRLIYDPRALTNCPIVQNSYPVSARFRFQIRRALRILLQEPEIRDYLLENTRFLEDLLELPEKLTKNKTSVL